MPLEDATVDVILSNCVINLCEDKGKVFEEIYRVLKRRGPAGDQRHGDRRPAACACGATPSGGRAASMARCPRGSTSSWWPRPASPRCARPGASAGGTSKGSRSTACRSRRIRAAAQATALETCSPWQQLQLVGADSRKLVGRVSARNPASCVGSGTARREMCLSPAPKPLGLSC